MMKNKNMILYILVSLIWGTTWLVIKYQIENTGVVAGVFYRFIISAIILFVMNYFLKNQMQYTILHHRFFILQGIFNFSINYILTYLSERYVSSAFIALTFTTLIYFNMIGLYFLYQKKIESSAILGTIIGGIGIFFIFSKQILNVSLNQKELYGIIIGVIATLSASLGNMASIKNHQAKIPVLVFNAWAMLYGSIFSLIVGLILQESFSFNPNVPFFTSLFYLTVFGTVIAFYAYQTLIIEIGAHRAAYTSIISPIIAVFVSMAFENFELTKVIIIGMILAILGNYLVLKRRVN
jgi:drug/metabolite transporter (DMT)-like permease